jgi:hypothetical protein
MPIPVSGHGAKCFAPQRHTVGRGDFVFRPGAARKVRPGNKIGGLGAEFVSWAGRGWRGKGCAPRLRRGSRLESVQSPFGVSRRTKRQSRVRTLCMHPRGEAAYAPAAKLRPHVRRQPRPHLRRSGVRTPQSGTHPSEAGRTQRSGTHPARTPRPPAHPAATRPSCTCANRHPHRRDRTWLHTTARVRPLPYGVGARAGHANLSCDAESVISRWRPLAPHSSSGPSPWWINVCRGRSRAWRVTCHQASGTGADRPRAISSQT